MERVCEFLKNAGVYYLATVEGTEDYKVEIVLREDGIDTMLCSCPYAENNNCKHMAAVLFAMEQSDPSIEELPPAKLPPIVSHVPMEIPWLDAIDNMSDSVIRKELMKLADRDDRLKERLAVLYLGKLPEYQLQNWKADLQELAGAYLDRTGCIDREDSWEYLNDLGNFLDAKLPTLLEVDAVMDAFHLVWIVMETALEWEIDDSYDKLSGLFEDCKDDLKTLWSMSTENQQEQMMQWYREHRNWFPVLHRRYSFPQAPLRAAGSIQDPPGSGFPAPEHKYGQVFREWKHSCRFHQWCRVLRFHGTKCVP